MTFPESVKYLSDLEAFGWRLDLSRMEALCERLGRPERAFKVVHVAGTNGKGSTTAMIAGILAHAGYKVGSYFSPFVFNIRERVMMAAPHEPPQMIPEDDFARILTELRPHVEAVAADESVGQPTEFEVKTMLAFLYFQQQGVDWAVLEVGLGGRLDATNVIPPPEVCVITNIGLDHTERLGETLELIAGEKAGIIKKGSAVVTGATEPALGVIRKTYEERGGAQWGLLEPRQKNDSWHGSRGVIEDADGRHEYVLDYRPGMEGNYQFTNAALAQLTANALNRRGFSISEAAMDTGISSSGIPGRYQFISNKPIVLLDGAHNREAANVLAVSLKWWYRERKIHFVIGMMGRHAVEGVVGELAPIAGRIIATQPGNERALPAERVAEEAAKHGFDASIITPPMDALKAALADAAREDVIVVTGSFYTVGEIDVAAVAAIPSPLLSKEGKGEVAVDQAETSPFPSFERRGDGDSETQLPSSSQRGAG